MKECYRYLHFHYFQNVSFKVNSRINFRYLEFYRISVTLFMVWPSICGKNGFAVQKNWFEFRLCLFHAEDSTPKRFDLPEQPFWFEKLTKFLNEDGFKNKALLTYEFFRGKKVLILSPDGVSTKCNHDNRESGRY